MKLEIFRPEDFTSAPNCVNSSNYTVITSQCAADRANARLNEWLSKNGKPVYSFYGDHWHERHTPEANNKISHKAWLICEKIIEK